MNSRHWQTITDFFSYRLICMPLWNLTGWHQDAKPDLTCHDIFIALSCTSNLGQQLQCISRYLYFQYFWHLTPLEHTAESKFSFLEVKMWVFFHISVCWITFRWKVSTANIDMMQAAQCRRLKINMWSSYATKKKKKSYTFKLKNSFEAYGFMRSHCCLWSDGNNWFGRH